MVENKWKFRRAAFLLGLCMFITGGSGLVAEYILGAVATYILGNSIEQMSITIAVMMFMMGVGAWAQKFLKREDRLIDQFLLIEIVVALLIGFAPIASYAAFGLLEHHFSLVLYGFMVAIGFLVGLEIPLVTRISARYVSELRINLANILSLDYAGAFVGAMIWVFWFLPKFPLTEIGFIVAGTIIVITILAYIFFLCRGDLRRSKSIGAMIVLCAVLLVVGYQYNRVWSTKLEQRLYDQPIVLAEQTKYQRLIMTHGKKLDDYRLFINGNLQFSSVDEAVYHEQLVHPVMTVSQNHSSVLILGGGDGLALREVLKYPDVEEVTLVDLDPGMTQLAKENPLLRKLNKGAFDDARVQVYEPKAVESGPARIVWHETEEFGLDGKPKVERLTQVQIYNVDADRFVEEVGGEWDVIIIDFPDPNSIELAKLYSREFYLKIRARLAPGGVIVAQATSPYHAKEAFLCIQRTMEAAGWATLPYHDNVPSFGDWGWILFTRPEDQLVVLHRASHFECLVETRYLTGDVFRSGTKFGRDRLTSASSEVNSLMNPVLLQLYTKQGWQID